MWRADIKAVNQDYKKVGEKIHKTWLFLTKKKILWSDGGESKKYWCSTNHIQRIAKWSKSQDPEKRLLAGKFIKRWNKNWGSRLQKGW